MNNKLQLISSKPRSEMEKSSGQLAAKALGALSSLAAKRNLVSGVAAPVSKLVGGMQKVYGRGQQGVAALRQGLGSSTDDLLKNPLFQRGAQNVSAGKALREQSGFLSGLRAPNPLQYRVGRGIGGLAIGAPLVLAPTTIAEYAGAANADPAFAEEYAKNMAYDRAESRLGQFKNMPFMDRMKAVYDPQSFTSQLQMPEAENLQQAMADNNLNNPGIMKYLASFNPFTGSPSDVISQKVRSEMMRNMQPKEAGEKQAMGLLAKAMPALRGMGQAFRQGRAAAKIKLPNQAPVWRTPPRTSIGRAGLNRAAYEVGKSPGSAALGLGGAAITPYFLGSSYDSGKNQVYNAAAENAMGMADLQLNEKFNQPGFMGGLGRAGMAIAPGMGSDMILQQIRQSMFPEVNNRGQ